MNDPTESDQIRPREVSDRQSIAIDALVSGATQQEAAEKAGVQRTTVTEWCNHNFVFMADRTNVAGIALRQPESSCGRRCAPRWCIWARRSVKATQGLPWRSSRPSELGISSTQPSRGLPTLQ